MTVTKKSPIERSLFHRHDAEAVHQRFKTLQRVDLGHDHVGAHALGPHGDTTSAPAIPDDDDDGPADQPVGGTHDAIHGGLPSAVAVIKHMFRVGVIDGDDGELEDLLFSHAAQTDHTRGGFFRPADHILQQFFPLGMQM